MKKIIYQGILISIMTILVFSMIKQMQELSKYSNVVIVSWTEDEKKQLTSFFENNKMLEDKGYYLRSKTSLTLLSRSIEDVTLYEVEESYQKISNIKMIKGRFINQDDCNNKSQVIVLGREEAITLFATTDCLNQQIDIGGMSYEVIGVFDTKYSLMERISQVENKKAYIPIQSQPNSVILVYKNGFGDLLMNSLENYKNVSGIPIKYYSVGQSVSMAIVIQNIFIFVLFSIALINVLRLLGVYIISHGLSISHGLLYEGLTEVKNENKSGNKVILIINKVTLLVIMIILFISLFQVFKQGQIPSGLLEEETPFLEGIVIKIIENNKNGFIVDFISYYARYSIQLLWIKDIILIFCFVNIMRDKKEMD